MTRFNRFFRLTALLTGLLAGVPLLAAPKDEDRKVEQAEEEEEEKSPLDEIKWQKGPCTGRLGSDATISVPKGLRFAGAEATQKAMEIMENPTDGSEVGMIMSEQGWFVIFEFADVGYVKDDEKDKLDAKAILDSIREGTEQGNEERKKRGWATLEVVGWKEKPHFDDKTKNLEWAVLARSQGDEVVNFNTRILGRRGYMSANLVADPQELKAVVPQYRKILSQFTYTQGNKYSEFRKGDKIAEYGLAALITGGAAAVAIKTGLLPKIWKLLVVVIAAVAAGAKKIWGKISGSR